MRQLAGRLHGWRGPIIEWRDQAILVSDEPAAQIDRLRDLRSRGIEEGLATEVEVVDGPGIVSEALGAPAGSGGTAGVESTRGQRNRCRIREAIARLGTDDVPEERHNSVGVQRVTLCPSDLPPPAGSSLRL